MSESNNLLSSSNKFRGSLSTALDLGRYFRVGVTHRQEHESQTGYTMDEQAEALVPMQMKSVQYSNSVDLTLILYYGKVFVPYLTFGAVRKNSATRARIGSQVVDNASPGSVVVPNGGCGMGIRLNRNFSLKLSYNVSPSRKLLYDESSGTFSQENVLDSFTSVGITYSI
ncbi:MAG: hypothetical protein OXT67_07685 [Zetaproteobacteria bacterium]|nr:hypothetical protein [Zetaproteobacteria bacterium]